MTSSNINGLEELAGIFNFLKMRKGTVLLETFKLTWIKENKTLKF